MILDTCFLIDLQREARKSERGRATDFLQMHADAAFSISVISVTEFLEGFAEPGEGERLLRAYTRINLDSKVAGQAARIRRDLRLEGDLIGDFDILIAATALSESLPLVTRNVSEFSRIKGLELIAY
ncbi:VapC toxin family PIN domain ribonuclease [Coraliomargarita sinensis]|uniref:Ribonuclease VapC n=1 Tax=Coraliomargarita sinensis TaxID=2174842 RepID=A0A317ZGH2_9BACT|nr:type II toxin-antitoxin system VapC family toxin [Coraliomargarita sinensis]PXA03457.1 VapC toxin family PIN domain ribonuclease [Coraliomargarita sinensis]